MEPTPEIEYPIKFRYGPGREQLLAIGVAAIILLAFGFLPHDFTFPRGASIALGGLFAMLGILLLLRKYLWVRHVIVESDAIVVPSGFLGMRPRRIAFASIDNPDSLPWRIDSGSDQIEIIAGMLPPDQVATFNDTFKRAMGPTLQTKIEASPEAEVDDDWNYYSEHCGWGGDGSVITHRDESCLNFKTDHRFTKAVSLLNSPPLTFSDGDGVEVLTIRRERRLPLPRYIMRRGDTPVCTINQKNILRTRYVFDFSDGETWDFRLPLFSIDRSGESSSGKKLQIQSHGHRDWAWRLEKGIGDDLLKAAVVFLHREKVGS